MIFKSIMTGVRQPERHAEHARPAQAAPAHGGAVPLTALAAGAEATVHTLAGGACFVSRLAALGFMPGVPVRIVQNCGRGPLIVLVRDTRVALGCGEATRVLVAAGVDGCAR